jgi:hypothetical protein
MLLYAAVLVAFCARAFPPVWLYVLMQAIELTGICFVTVQGRALLQCHSVCLTADRLCLVSLSCAVQSLPHTSVCRWTSEMIGGSLCTRQRPAAAHVCCPARSSFSCAAIGAAFVVIGAAQWRPERKLRSSANCAPT